MRNCVLLIQIFLVLSQDHTEWEIYKDKFGKVYIDDD
jgi:hypothetical protein